MIYLSVTHLVIMNEYLDNIAAIIPYTKMINPYAMLIYIVFKLRNSFLNTKLSKNN